MRAAAVAMRAAAEATWVGWRGASVAVEALLSAAVSEAPAEGAGASGSEVLEEQCNGEGIELQELAMRSAARSFLNAIAKGRYVVAFDFVERQEASAIDPVGAREELVRGGLPARGGFDPLDCEQFLHVEGVPRVEIADPVRIGRARSD